MHKFSLFRSGNISYSRLLSQCVSYRNQNPPAFQKKVTFDGGWEGKLGMRQEGHFIKDQQIRGVWRDNLLFAIVREEYQHT